MEQRKALDSIQSPFLMEESTKQFTAFIGRDEELAELNNALDGAIGGGGSAFLLSGEAGIGKTRLVEEFRGQALERNVRILSGAALADQRYPFLIFSKALEEMEASLFEEMVYKRFTKLFAVDGEGHLTAQASPEGDEELDTDLFASMLSTVQDFIRDSFDVNGETTTGLGRLEYGDMKVLIEHGQDLFLAAVFKGAESSDMKNVLKRAVHDIEESRVDVQDKINSLAGVRFLVRRELAGVQLDKERVRIADEVLGIIVKIARAKPLLLILEDLHWADESSLFVLSYLARNVRDENIMILGTLRPEESSALQNTIDNMKNEETIAQIDLERLGRDNVSLLVNTICPSNEFPASLFDNISAQCEGNPFFVTEMLRHMTEMGNIARQDGKFVLVDEDYVIPGTIEDMADKRLEMLEPDSMALAEYVSCVGREFDRDVIKSITTLKDPEIALDKLQKQGILTLKNGTGEFHHAIYQDVLYKGLGDRWKAAYHKSLGEYYEDAFADRPDIALFEMARHFSNTNEKQKARDYCLRAGEKAETAFAPEQAIEYYNMTLDALTELKLDRTISMEVDILTRLGELNFLVGEFERANDCFTYALNKEKDHRKKAGLYRKIAEVYEKKGDYERSIGLLSKAMKTIDEEDGKETARIYNAFAWIFFRKGEYDKSIEFNQKSIPVAEKFGAKKEFAQANHQIGTNYLQKGDFQSALRFLNNGLEMNKKINDIKGLSASYNNLGVAHKNMGELGCAVDYYHKSLEMIEKTGDKYGMGVSYNNIGLVYYEKGDFSAAHEYYTKALKIKERIGDVSGVAATLNNLGNVQYTIGNLDQALEFYENSLGIRERIKENYGIATAYNNIGELYMARGEHLKAVKWLEKSIKISQSIGKKDLLSESYIGLSECWSMQGDYEKGLMFGERALEIAKEIGLHYIEASAHRVLGIAHRETGDWKCAKREFDMARDIFMEIDEKKLLANLYYEYAFLFKAKGEPDKAREHLERALPEFERMGMKLWEEKCRKVLEELK